MKKQYVLLPLILKIVPGIGISFNSNCCRSLRKLCVRSTPWSIVTLQKSHWDAKCLSAKPQPNSPTELPKKKDSSQVVHGHDNWRLHLWQGTATFGGSFKLSHAIPDSVSKNSFACPVPEYSMVSLSIRESMATHGSPVLQSLTLPYRMQSSRKARGFSM